MICKIHSKYYDLSNFKHPGGDIPIALADGRDATELFESHHLFSDRDKIMKILNKYEIANHITSIEDNNSFDWTKTLTSEFTRELKEVLQSTLKHKDIKIGLYGIIEALMLCLLYIMNAYYYFRGNTIALLFYPFSLWLFTVNVYHDASHFALSFNPIINRLGTYTGLMFSLTYCWYHQHILGHHTHVNILSKDPDLYHSPLFLRHTSNIRKNRYHRYQHITVFLLWPVAVPLGLILTGFMKTINNKPYNKVVPLTASLNKNSLYYEFAFVIMYMLIIPYMVCPNICFVTYPYMMYSIIFMICTQVNHLTLETFQTDKNYYIHQIINSHNISPNSFLTTLFMGALNLQIEHHLVPSVHHTRLRMLQPKIRELCRKHSIHYPCSEGLFEALSKHIKMVYNNSL